jgi:hypothetical protein
MLWPTFYLKSASKDNKQLHIEFYEKIKNWMSQRIAQMKEQKESS